MLPICLLMNNWYKHENKDGNTDKNWNTDKIGTQIKINETDEHNLSRSVA
jgi:hypothetical protein